jgi:PAS domain-containing protein
VENGATVQETRSESNVLDVLAELSRRGITLEPRGDALAFRPRRKVTGELKAQLERHKPDILRLLRGEPATESAAPVRNVVETPPDADVSVVVLHPLPSILDAVLVGVLGQRPAPREVLVVGHGNRRLRKCVRRFAGRGVRFADSPTDATGEFVLLLDGRALLGTAWISSAVPLMDDPQVGAVYSDHELLTTGGRTNYPDEVGSDDLARSGLEAATVLVRREARVAAAGDDVSVTRLLRRLLRSGWRLRKCSVPVLFRGGPKQTYFERQELASETVTLFIPLAGREHLWRETRRFLDNQTWPHEQIRLILCDTSQDPQFARLVRDWTARCDYPDVRHLRCAVQERGLADAPRDKTVLAVNQAMCRIYNRLRESITTDYVWVLEDDIVPPDDVLEQLLRAFNEDVASVCAPYRSRFDGRYLVWSRERAGSNGVHQLAPPLPDRPQVQDVRGSGFGCLVLRAEVLRPHIFCLPAGEVCFDVRFFRTLDPRWKRRVDWSCECRHLHNAHRPKGRIAKRNLLYHITPFATNDIWLRNVRQLLKRIDLFNGRRVIAVATGDGLVPPDEIRNAFGRHEIEILTRPNSSELRENATFLPLLKRIADPDPHTATFYAHAKGVAKDVLCLGDPLGSRYWRNAMYHELLDDWERINELLEDYAIVGTHRRQHNEDHRIYPDGQSESSWHFAGTFFWFRNADVFATNQWREVWQPTGWGAEAWPGRMFDFEQSACVAYDGLVDHYNPASYDPQIEDE